MKGLKRIIMAGVWSMVLFLFAGWAALAANLGEMGGFNESDDGVIIKFSNGLVKVSRLEDGIIRVRATDKDKFEADRSFALAPDAPSPVAVKVMEDASGLIFETGLVKGRVSRQGGALTLWDKSGNLLMEEPKSGGIFFEKGKVGVMRVSPPEEHYYGFGEKTGSLDKRGSKMVMWNTDNTYTTNSDPLYQSHPYYLALRKGRAYGIFQDSTYKSIFDVGSSSANLLKYTAEAGELNYYFLYGPSPKEVIQRYGLLVGRYPLPPLWALGNMQCRWSYKNERQVRAIASKFRTNNVPCDVLFLDIHYMDKYKVFTFNKNRFPDPAGLFAELGKQGFKVITIVDPGVKIEKGYYVYEQGLENDYFVRSKKGGYFKANVWPGACYFPDFFRPEAREWWGGLHKFLWDAGVDGVWDDMNEISAWARDVRLGDYMLPFPGTVNFLDMVYGAKDHPVDAALGHNAYASLEEEATYNGLKKLRPDERPFIITRAGYPGVQRYSSMWTGDNSANWPQLKMALAMLLNLGISGQVMVGSDIGGFVGTPSSELYARWLEQGVFYPFCRTHTMELTPSQDPFSYGKDVLSISKAMIELRYRLLPYTYSYFKQASETGLPVMRAVFLEFPGDEQSFQDASEFMWGEHLLVAPVVEEWAKSRMIHLPPGKWYRFESSSALKGPRDFEEKAGLGLVPLFAREGAIIPLAPVMNYSSEKPWSPLLVEFYPGRSKTCFTLYEDEGQGFNYLKGNYLETSYCQEPGEKELVLRKSDGEGGFRPSEREVRLKIFGVKKPESVQSATASGLDKLAYSYDAQAETLELRLKDSVKGFAIKVSY